jgi:hypothetical protein
LGGLAFCRKLAGRSFFGAQILRIASSMLYVRFARGVDFDRPAIKLPALGRIGLP